MEKLYEKDAYLTRFDAVVETCKLENGVWHITLNRTAFYPEGGGQPWDTGTLGGVSVLEVHSRDGQVVHHCDGPLVAGTSVTGEIDFARRFDLMQQHSGEHIVSGFAHSLYGCENVGFHLGADMMTIDLSLPLEESQIRALEDAANRYIWEDHPVSITYPSQEALAALSYRSKRALNGSVRIVSFPGADTCACCGTHVSSSGQVGLVKLISHQPFRQGVRIELLCGKRALNHLSRAWEENRRVSNLFSAKQFETSLAAQRILEENRRWKEQSAQAEMKYFACLAREIGPAPRVVCFEEGLCADSLRRLADTLLEACGGLVACFSGSEEEGYKYAIGLGGGGDLRPFIRRFNEALHGRGGGKSGFAQGGINASRGEIEAFLASSGADLTEYTQ